MFIEVGCCCCCFFLFRCAKLQISFPTVRHPSGVFPARDWQVNVLHNSTHRCVSRFIERPGRPPEKRVRHAKKLKCKERKPRRRKITVSRAFVFDTANGFSNNVCEQQRSVRFFSGGVNLRRCMRSRGDNPTTQRADGQG